MNEEFKRTVNEMVGYPVDISFKQIFEEDGIKYSDVLTVMQCKRLDRIADALEGINSNLGEMRVTLEILQRYVDGFTTVDEKGMRIGVSGDVNTY